MVGDIVVDEEQKTQVRPTHRHSLAKNRTVTEPFSRSVAAIPAALNPAAHHGTCQVNHCLCGATRRININGNNQERGMWEGGDPNYQENRNQAAVSLGKLSSKVMTEKKRLALTANASKPRGARAERIETLKSEVVVHKLTTETEARELTTVINESGDPEIPSEPGIPIIRRTYRCVTPGGRISWSARWFCGDKIVKVQNSVKKPVFGENEDYLR